MAFTAAVLSRRVFQSMYHLKKPVHVVAMLRWSSTASSSEDEKISRFPVPELNDVPEDLRKMMLETCEKAGFIPNVFKTMAHRPEELRGFIKYHNTVMNDREGGNIGKADKELIVVAVSSLNRCHYCTIAHSALFRIFSKDPILADQVAVNWETADLDARQKAIVNFAIQNAQCKPLEDSHFQALYDNGLNEEDAWDIGSVVALFSLSNRLANLINMKPNKEFYMLGRLPVEKNK